MQAAQAGHSDKESKVWDSRTLGWDFVACRDGCISNAQGLVHVPDFVVLTHPWAAENLASLPDDEPPTVKLCHLRSYSSSISGSSSQSSGHIKKS